MPSRVRGNNGLVTPGIKPLPEPVLTQIYVTKWRHKANALSFSKLRKKSRGSDNEHIYKRLSVKAMLSYIGITVQRSV